MQKKLSKPPSETTEQKIQWHPGFVAAMKLELRDYNDQLTFHEEHLLNPKPIQIDLLIIEKTEDLVIKEPIGRHFRRHNIFEYKSPGDDLSVDNFFKTMGYACIYKAAAKKVNEIPAEDVLVTLVRADKPGKLLKWLRESYVVEESYPGVYYIENAGLFPVQIIVSDELPERDAIWLQSLTNRLQVLDAKNLLANIEETRYVKDERELIESVLQVALAANREAFDKMRKEDPSMYDALRDFMAADFQKAEEKGIARGMEKGVGIGELRKAKATAKKLSKIGMPIDKIAGIVDVSVQQVEEWLSDSLVMA